MKNFKHLLFILMCLSSIQLMATNYYVSPGGNDSNSGTSTGSPFKTITRAGSVAGPGDVVNISDGTYSNSTISNSGNTNAYIVFKSTNKWGAKIVASGGSDALKIDGNFIEIDGIEVTNPDGHGINGEDNHHIRILNCHAYGCGNSGISLGHNPNSSSMPCDYYYVEGNTTNNNALLGFYHGISIYHAIPYDAASGFHNIIRNNISYSNITAPASSDHRDGNGIIVDDFNFTQEDISNSSPYPYQTLVENNVCYNNGGGGIKIVWSDHVMVRNNTLYRNAVDNYDTGTYKGNMYVDQARDCKFINNIIYCDPTVNSNISAIMDKRTASGSSNVENIWAYNLLYDGTSQGDNNIDVGDGSNPTLTNNISGDPLFVDKGITSSSDFHLQSSSPAIDAGTSNYGLPTVDLDGNTRIQGSAVDIGSYEYGGGGSTISVTGVSVSPTSASLYTDDTQQLTATISPSNATNQNVSWSTSNSSVATVSSSGLVTGVSAGSATITVTTQDGNKTATCSATVTSGSSTSYSVFTTQTPATSGTDGPYELGMKFQSSSDGTITKIRYYKVNNEDGSHTGRIWSNGGSQLASVSFSGETSSGWQEATLDTPLSIDANITYVVTVNSNSAYGATNNGLQSVVSNGPLSSIADASNGVYGSLNNFPTNSWQNSNYFRDVVFVPESTTVAVTGVSVSPTSSTMDIDDTQQLSATISPSNATNQNKSWSSSNSSVATVSSSGLVTAVSEGSATITVTTQDGNKTATCSITVNAAPTNSIEINSSPATITPTGTFTVNASYTVSQSGTIKIMLMSPSSTWLGEDYVTVSANDSGTSDFNITISSAMNTGAGYYFYAAVKNPSDVTMAYDEASVTVENASIAVTSVSVSPTSSTMDINDTQQLMATISPINATNQNVTWSSLNTSVATVNSNGLVTAIAAGTATITVTTEDGNKTATCAITVSSTIPDDLLIEAEDFCGSSGISSWSTGIGNISGGNYAKYCSVDFETGYNELLFDHATSISGSISIRINSSTGTEIGTFSYSTTGGWDSYTTVATDISSSVTGTHDLFLVGVSGTLNLDQITLHYNTSKSQQLNLPESTAIQQSIAVYPNPVENRYLNIHSSKEKILEVKIMSMEGKILIRQSANDQKVQIELSGLKAGLYITSVLTQTGTINEKFIIK